MPESFFQIGQPSRCPFSPELNCEPFPHDEPMGRLEFFGDVVSQFVTAVLPRDADPGHEHWAKVFEQIQKAWGDRRVGFRSVWVDQEAWTEDKPCDPCNFVRQGQVVVIDLYNGQLDRTEIFLSMATESATAVQQLSLANIFGDVPLKKIILINQGEFAGLPQYYQYQFDFINYANKQGDADLNLLREEMRKIALKGDLLTQDDDTLVLDFDDLGIEEPVEETAVAPPDPSEIADEDLITIINSEDFATGPATAPPASTEKEPKNTAEKMQAVNAFAEHMKTYGLTADFDQMDIWAKLFKRAVQFMEDEEYLQALQELYKSIPSSLEWLRYKQALIEQCLQDMPPPQILTFFFNHAVSPPRDRLTLSPWSDDSNTTAVNITDSELNKYTGDTSVPLRFYPHLTADQVDKWYEEISQNHEEKVYQMAILVTANSDEINVGLRLLKFREDEEPPFNFLKFRLQDIQKSIREEQDSFTFVHKQIVDHFTTAPDLYDRTTQGIVSENGEFFGRQFLIDKLVQYLRGGSNFAIYGMRRTGKTSVLRRLQKIDQLDDYLVVEVDVQTPALTSIVELYDFVTRRIIIALQKNFPVSRYPPEKYPILDWNKYELFNLDNDASLKEYQRLFVDDLTRLLTALRQEPRLKFEKLVLLLDEVGILFPDKYPGDKGVPGYRKFLTQLRSLSSSETGLVIGIVVFGPYLKKELSDYQSPFYDQFQKLPIGMLTASECAEMITTIGRQMTLFYADGVCEDIYRFSGGDPQLTKYLCSEIFVARDNKQGLVEKKDVERGIARFFAGRSERVADIFNHFKLVYPHEAKVLEKMSLGLNEIGKSVPLNRLDLPQYSDDMLHDAARVLYEYGLVQQKGANFEIRLGLLHLWLNSELRQKYLERVQ